MQNASSRSAIVNPERRLRETRSSATREDFCGANRITPVKKRVKTHTAVDNAMTLT